MDELAQLVANGIATGSIIALGAVVIACAIATVVPLQLALRRLSALEA